MTDIPEPPKQTERYVFEQNRLVAVEYLEGETLLVRYDLVEGKCYNYSLSGEPEITDMTPETIEHFLTMDTVEARLARIEAHLWPPSDDPTDPDDPTVPTWDDLGGFWPNGGLIRDAGTTWLNVSGSVLTTPPSGFPGDPDGWTHLFVEVTTTEPDPEPDPERPEGYVGPWDKDATYSIGDVVDRDGEYYSCKVAHGPEYQGTWGPPNASVWDDLGPV